MTYHSDRNISEITDTMIELDESRRAIPNAEAVNQYDSLKSLYNAVSRRIQGIPSNNPFTISKLFNA